MNNINFVIIDILESLRPGSPKPGRIERIDVNDRSDMNKTDDPIITQRFLKINVRHITDGQGVVGGVLLVTPNAVMFDPNVSDPLVIEHGPESYGVIAPMELCVNAAIFHDIAHMRVSGGAVISADNTNATEKPEIYYPKAVLEAQIVGADNEKSQTQIEERKEAKSAEAKAQTEATTNVQDIESETEVGTNDYRNVSPFKIIRCVVCYFVYFKSRIMENLSKPKIVRRLRSVLNLQVLMPATRKKRKYSKLPIRVQR